MLNVGLTRSTKYLFVGFTSTFPSRYLKQANQKLSDYAYVTWDESQNNIPEPYCSIIQCQKYNRPVWTSDKYRKEKVNTGSKSNLQVKDDISKDFEQAKIFINHDWNKNVVETCFGNEQEFKTPLKEDHFMILGLFYFILIAFFKEKNCFDL